MIELFTYVDAQGKERKIKATLYSSIDEISNDNGCLFAVSIRELPNQISMKKTMELTRGEMSKRKPDSETIIQCWLLAFHKFEIIEKIFEANKQGKSHIQVICE